MSRFADIEIDSPTPESKPRKASSKRQPQKQTPKQTPKQTQKQTQKQNKWLRALRIFVDAVMVVINSVICMGMVASAYAHTIPPSSWPISSALAMTFGWWFTACVAIFVLDLIWWRRTAWIAGLSMLACLGPIHDYSPLNIPNFGMSDSQKERAFTFMTYNTFRFNDLHDKNPVENRQLDYILKRQPDIVCIQEAEYLAPTKANAISQRQIDSLHIVYPYILTQGSEFAILSKYEAKPININFPRDSFPTGDIAAWRLHIDDRVLNIFSVHLRSFALSDSDKERYQDIVKLDSIGRKELNDVRADILPKITSAAIDRERQIEYLEKYLAKYGGVNAIVCGDFNDPVCCYGLHSLENVSKMRQVYAQVGFGPAITYNANYLFFRIDHILYRGNLRPWSIKRCGIDASDHYPLLATFVFDY